jgi:hypothetical protein
MLSSGTDPVPPPRHATCPPCRKVRQAHKLSRGLAQETNCRWQDTADFKSQSGSALTEALWSPEGYAAAAFPPAPPLSQAAGPNLPWAGPCKMVNSGWASTFPVLQLVLSIPVGTSHHASPRTQSPSF